MTAPRTCSPFALLLPLALACATDSSGGPPAPQAPGQPNAAAPAAEVEVAVDERPPVPIDQWRTVK